jgi:hypothetical protein
MDMAARSRGRPGTLPVVRRISCVVCSSLLLAAAAARTSELDEQLAPLTAPELPEADRARLEAGEVLVRDLQSSDPDGIGVLVIGVVEAPADRLWALMADCEQQDEFMPRITHAEVRDRAEDAHTCDLVVDVPFPLEDLRTATRHRVRRLPDGGYQRWWRLEPGDWSYHTNSGSWTVHPRPDGRTSLLVNRMDLLPKTIVPRWVLRDAHARQAPETYEAIRLRIRQSPDARPGTAAGERDP